MLLLALGIAVLAAGGFINYDYTLQNRAAKRIQRSYRSYRRQYIPGAYERRRIEREQKRRYRAYDRADREYRRDVNDTIMDLINAGYRSFGDMGRLPLVKPFEQHYKSNLKSNVVTSFNNMGMAIGI